MGTEKSHLAIPTWLLRSVFCPADWAQVVAARPLLLLVPRPRFGSGNGFQHKPRDGVCREAPGVATARAGLRSQRMRGLGGAPSHAQPPGRPSPPHVLLGPGPAFVQSKLEIPDLFLWVHGGPCTLTPS